jgi:hypothetical protein
VTITLSLPSVGASDGTWGTIANAAFNQLNAYIVGVRKTVDESVTSSTAVQDDNALAVAVAASCIYEVRWSLLVDGATAGDLKYAFTGPASATMVWESTGHAAADTTNVAQITTPIAAIGTTITHGTLGSGTDSRVNGRGLLVVAATPGTLQLQWAQGTSSGTATKVKAASYLVATRIG